MQIAEPLLGTRAEVAVAGLSDELAELAETAIFDEVRRLETLFTIFDEASALHSFRRTGESDVPELLAVVELAIDWHRRTEGAFHPAIQPLTDVWDAAAVDGEVPSSDRLASVCAELRRFDSGSAFAEAGATGLNLTGLNLNGIAKGWIADHALAVAFAPAVAGNTTSAWLNLGGDVAHRGDSSLLVGIEDPARPYDNVAPMATIEISNEALATSGGGRRWWTIDGVRHSKVLDPRTGQPTNHIRSATVVAPTAEAADVLATACLVLEPDHAVELTQRENAECFLVCVDGSIVTSSARFVPTS